MTGVILDASSVLWFLKRRKTVPFPDSMTLSLLPYEVGNGLWREVHHLNHLTREEADTLLEAFHGVYAMTHVINVENEKEAKKILAAALENDLTYYDAAYLYESLNYSATLITDDRKLSEAARRNGVHVETSPQSLRMDE